MKNPLFCFAIFFLFMFLSGCDYVRLSRPPDDERGAPPRLYIGSDRLDLGTASSGETVQKGVMIRNIGGTPLRIHSAEASCGCTVLSMDRNVIPSGKSANLDIIIDTSGKIGPVEKTITLHTNDVVEPEKILILKLMVQPPDHEPFEVGKTSIFQSDCRRCHVVPGAGLKGEALFEADCAMCHRSKDAPYSAGAPIELLRLMGSAELDSAIRKGVEGTSMPGFHTSAGGPLTAEEIDSIVRYLKTGP